MREKNFPEIDPNTFGEPALTCPQCGDGWLHQCGVDVFVRHGEDSPEGQHIDANYGEGVEISKAVSSSDGNPSRRRDGIKIQFWCEHCSPANQEPHHELVIEQHKGNEFIYWQKVDRSDGEGDRQ
jgi:hypothetical protein